MMDKEVKKLPEAHRPAMHAVYGVREDYIASVFDAVDACGGDMKYLETALLMDKHRVRALRSLYLN